MGPRLLKPAPLGVALSGILSLALAVPAADAQCNPPPRCYPPGTPLYPSPYAPAQPGASTAPSTTAPGTTPSTATPATPEAEPSLGAEQSAAAGGGTVALAAPNMLGNLLGAGRSISFFYQRTSGSVFINGTGATNISNPKVADNNSPLPQDRVYFRYNFFKDSLSVTGDTGEAFFDPSLGLSRLSAPRFRGVTQVKGYDVHDFTFGGEKTFLDGIFSAEVRVPFNHTLASKLDLSVAQITGIGLDEDGDSSQSIIRTVPTPENTFGHSDTEFGNMTLILKALILQRSWLAVSGGASIGMPTAPDTRVTVTDFLGDQQDNDIEILRQRLFHVHNETWSVSPFVALLATPGDRFFAQGFLQVDLPVNKSKIDYSEVPILNTEPSELTSSALQVTDEIREQTLLQVDVGTGYWLIKDRRNALLTGLAPTVELHYTTTLNSADLRVLPTAPKSAGLSVVGPNGTPISEPNPTVGSRRGRVDLLDATVGTTFVFGERTTLATGFAFPLREHDDRTFNWEFQLQLNFYFGGGFRSSAPNF